MLGHLIDTETDIAIRQGGKRGAKLKDNERLLARFEKEVQRRDADKKKKDEELKRRYVQRKADMAKASNQTPNPAKPEKVEAP